VRKHWIVGGMTIGLLAIIALVAINSDDDLGLELQVKSFPLGSLLTIKNTGTGPTHILDVSINDREECSIFPYGQFQDQYSKAQIHQSWVNGDVPSSRAPMAKELRVGDSISLEPPCGVVRVTVTTDRGTETFSFK
jgi:hypothetical protein